MYVDLIPLYYIYFLDNRNDHKLTAIGTVYFRSDFSSKWINYQSVSLSKKLQFHCMFVVKKRFKEAIVSSIQLLYRSRNDDDLGGVERQNSIGMHDSTNTIIAMIYLQTGPYEK